MKNIFLVFSLLSFIGVVSAQTTRYVTDETKFPIRTGRSTQTRLCACYPVERPSAYWKHPMTVILLLAHRKVLKVGYYPGI